MPAFYLIAAVPTAPQPAKPHHVALTPGQFVHGGGSAAAGTAAGGELFAADVDSFRGLGLTQALSDHLASLSFATPTRVQQRTIPLLLVSPGALLCSSSTWHVVRSW